MLNAVRKRATTSAPVKKILALITITGLLAVLVTLTSTTLNPSPAEAAAKVSVFGTPKADGESSLDLSGSGFQSVEGGFGGIYVLFGWVDDQSGGWRPSKGGVTGTNYRYVYDDETNPTGYQVFVTFPGSSTAYAANGGEIAANGTWKATIRVPGSTFTTYDRAQNETQVDCTQVQCGIITIGAHGVTNANNESFTPVDFSASGAAASGDAEKKDEDAMASDSESEKKDDTETTDAAETTSADTGTSGSGTTGSGTANDAGVQAPAVAPVESEPPMSTSWLIFFAILAGVLVLGSIIAIGLGFGIGGYLAVKSLLLGVSPAAMEKERDRREKKRIRTKHKLAKRRIRMQRRKKLQLAKLERSSERAVAQSSHQGGSNGAGKLPPQVIAFFEDENTGPGSRSRVAAEAGDGSAPDFYTGGFVPGAGKLTDGGADAQTDPEERRDTRVLARVRADEAETTTLPETK
ncbi:hypothetical protein [Brevibacterium aurantiacum]|uniref:Uncharacterized protein n=1 Tax=Brevibacterium aurantiacum TaxID=273384 RepID=A0A556CAY4_BREAU|nr:hypothetical protein [Brevibacterium aurantiacum]TSI14560.1 hypothetical protein FO013_14435 [Brevibacterium aurantiacum]